MGRRRLRRGADAEPSVGLRWGPGGGGRGARRRQRYSRRRARTRASKLLRCLPASRLLAADLADSTTAPPAGPTLHARTEPAAMGEVTAFLSHSWSDEKEAPGAKHAAVSRWAARHRKKTGDEPTLWLVALARLIATFSRRT